MSTRRFEDLRLLQRVLREAAPYRWQIVGTLLLALLATPVGLLAPLPLKVAVDSVLGSEPLPGVLQPFVPRALSDRDGGLLLVAVCLVVVIALLTQIQWAAYWMLSTYTGERLVLGFRSRLFQHVQRLSLAYHDTRGSGDTIYRVQHDAPAIQWIVLDGLLPMISSVLKLSGMLLVTYLIEPMIALVALTIAPLLFGLTRYYRGHIRQQWSDVKKLESSALSLVQEVIGALRVVKAFGQEDRESTRFLQQSRRSMGARLRVILWESAFGLLVGLLMASGTAAVLYLGVRQVQQGALSLGDLLIVMAYLGQLYEPLKSLSKNVTALQRSLASAERAFGLLDEAPDVVERPDARPLRRARGALACRNVSFAYDADHPVLRDVTFDVPAGSRVGILGPTGAGKTTLVNLLTRFYDAATGAVLLDDTDVREYRLADLRRQYSMVLQEPVLLSTSIAENIAYARADATEAEIVAAARAANAHDFISRMPGGYDTLVGERGLRLSGGERQRISLARAFLKDAPILILDEPTSSIDGRTESAIMEAMDRLMQGRTTLMIAHRLSTLRNCDLLLKLAAGRVIEQSADVAETLAAEEQSWRVPSAGIALTEAGGA